MKIKHTPVFKCETIEECVGKTFTLKGLTNGMALLSSDEGEEIVIGVTALNSFSTYSDEKSQDGYRQYLQSKINKLALGIPGYAAYLMALPTEKLEEVLKNNPCSGKTTAKALEHIVKAIQNPGVSVELVHDQGTSEAHGRFMRQRVGELIDQLEFKFLVIGHIRNTLTFEI